MLLVVANLPAHSTTRSFSLTVDLDRGLQYAKQQATSRQDKTQRASMYGKLTSKPRLQPSFASSWQPCLVTTATYCQQAVWQAFGPQTCVLSASVSPSADLKQCKLVFQHATLTPVLSAARIPSSCTQPLGSTLAAEHCDVPAQSCSKLRNSDEVASQQKETPSYAQTSVPRVTVLLQREHDSMRTDSARKGERCREFQRTALSCSESKSLPYPGRYPFSCNLVRVSLLPDPLREQASFRSPGLA